MAKPATTDDVVAALATTNALLQQLVVTMTGLQQCITNQTTAMCVAILDRTVPYKKV